MIVSVKTKEDALYLIYKWVVADRQMTEYYSSPDSRFDIAHEDKREIEEVFRYLESIK